MNTDSITYLDRLFGLTHEVETYGSDRACSHDGCTTRLSKYNPEDTCSVHTVVDEPLTAMTYYGITFCQCRRCGQVKETRDFPSGDTTCTACRTMLAYHAAESRAKRVKAAP